MTQERFTPYDKINEVIIKALEQDIVPWHKPWTSNKVAIPMNLATKEKYNGLNIFLLTFTSHLEGFNSPYWISFLQAKSLNITIKKGAHSTPITFWRKVDKEIDKSGQDKGIKTKTKTKENSRTDQLTEIKEYSFLRYYNVFNLSQCELPDNFDVNSVMTLDQDIELHDNDVLLHCESVVDGYSDKPEIKNINPNNAFYDGEDDFINVPDIKRFDNSEVYYGALFHELIHSTGHKDRLNRFKKGAAVFSNENYSQEELVAEIGSAYLCFHCGIENITLENSTRYIHNWLEKLKDPKNKRWLVDAFKKAEYAVKYILNKTEKKNEQ